MNQATSERPETPAREYLTRHIQICRVYSCSDVIWKVISKKEVKMDYTKIDTADLDSPCQEVSNGGLRFVIHSPSGSFVN